MEKLRKEEMNMEEKFNLDTFKVKSNEEGVCPFCNGVGLKYTNRDFEGDMMCLAWECPDCSHTGEEWYKLTWAGHNVDTPDGSIEIEDKMIQPEDTAEPKVNKDHKPDALDVLLGLD